MTAFGTVAAAVAAVVIAVASSRRVTKLMTEERKLADQRLLRRFSHSDEQFGRQQERVGQRLTEQVERAAQLEQRSEAAAEVISYRLNLGRSSGCTRP